MNNSKIWILITGVILMVSGFFIYSTLKSKAEDRVTFLSKIQDLNVKITDLNKAAADLQQTLREKNEQQSRMQSDLAGMENQLGDSRKNETTLRSRIDALAREKESLTKYMENNNAIVAKLQKKIQSLQEERRQLEESKNSTPSVSVAAPQVVDSMSDEAAKDNDADGPRGSKVAQEDVVDLGRIIIHKPTNQPAAVEYINSLYGFVVLSAGTGDGLRRNSIVNITRNNRFIAKAVVKKTRRDVATAVTLPEWTREEIKVGDLVSVNNATL